jgi:hypothetical protein
MGREFPVVVWESGFHQDIRAAIDELIVKGSELGVSLQERT